MAESCPRRNSAAAFASGQIDSTEAQAWEQHCSGCLDCAEELERLTQAQLAELALSPGLGSVDFPLPPVALEVVRRMQTERRPGLPALDAFQILKSLDPPRDAGCLAEFAGYDILEVIGRGGMGLVFKARDHTLDRIVALKILFFVGSGQGELTSRFLNEARALAAIQSDYVAPIYQAGVEKGWAFLVMPYFAAGTLDHWLADGEPITPTTIALVGYQLAKALAAIHERGLLHRDLKPSNVLLEEGLARVRLADFGLACVQTSSPGNSPVNVLHDPNGTSRIPPNDAAGELKWVASTTLSRMIAGTPDYMSPEQARGEALDPRSDLFGLGAVLYQMATGRTPYHAATAGAVLQAARRGDLRPVREYAPSLPRALAAIIDRLLARRPEDRFASAQESAAALEWLVNSRDRARGRARWLAGIAAAALLLAMAIVALLDWNGRTVVVNTLLSTLTGETYYIRGRFGTFARLPDAVAAASADQIIEVRFSGERLTDSFRLEGRPLTIRAAPGFAPVLVATNNAQPLILVDAPLTLEGLTLWRRGRTSNFAALIVVENAPLRLLNCRVLRSVHQGQPLLVWGRLRARAFNEARPARAYRALLAFEPGSSGRLRNCVVAGTQTLAIGARTLTNAPVHVAVENSLMVVDRVIGPSEDNLDKVEISSLDSVFVTSALIDMWGNKTKNLFAAGWTNSLVDRHEGVLVGVGRNRDDRLADTLKWGESNVIYAGQGGWLQSGDARPLQSEAEWNRLLDVKSSNRRVVKHLAFPELCVRSGPTLQAVDLAPETLSVMRAGAGSFDPRVIGEGTAYATFRESPAYAQWRDEKRVLVNGWRHKR